MLKWIRPMAESEFKPAKGAGEWKAPEFKLEFSRPIKDPSKVYGEDRWEVGGKMSVLGRQTHLIALGKDKQEAVGKLLLELEKIGCEVVYDFS